jgi:hypothetical protein
MLSVTYRHFLLSVLILNVIMMSLQAQLKGGGGTAILGREEKISCLSRSRVCLILPRG